LVLKQDMNFKAGKVEFTFNGADINLKTLRFLNVLMLNFPKI
jgi:hypothetical protein